MFYMCLGNNLDELAVYQRENLFVYRLCVKSKFIY